MRADTMPATLIRQQFTLERTRAALADALANQDAAERLLAAAEHCIRGETERAVDPEAGDQLVEAFAAWLPEGQRRKTDAQDALDFAAAQAAQARAAMAMVRAALAARGLADNRHPSAADGAGGHRD